MFYFSHVSFSYGDHRVLDDVTVEASSGHRLAIIGENGAGKSTALSLFAGLLEPDAGLVTSDPGFAYVAQHTAAPSTDETVGTSIERALRPLHELERELESAARALGAGTREAESAYDVALRRAEARDVWSASERAEISLAGLGLKGLARDTPVAQLSGGQQARLALAMALIERPDGMLLDEPTNHLDGPARAFLAEQLCSLPGAVVFSSHDRAFLEQVPTHIFDLDPGYGAAGIYRGNYGDYLREKAAERRRWEQEYRDQQAELARLKAATQDKARAVAHHREMKDNNKMAYGRHGDLVEQQISRRIRNTRERITRIEHDLIPEPPQPLALHLRGQREGMQAPAGLAVMVRNLDVPGRIHVASLDIAGDARIVLTGKNGSGKSSFLEVLAGNLPGYGTVQFANGVRAGLLGQHERFQFEERTARRVYADESGEGAPRLTSLGLLAEVDEPVRTLSAGQRRRLELAILLAQEPSVLLLDEPTNHLSLRLCDELFDALPQWPGAVIVATHDESVIVRPEWSVLRIEGL